MSPELSCEQVVALAPELALGVADGHERDAGLRHLGSCASCRHVVSELSATADDLLLLAPEHEAPSSLESRVLGAIGGSEGRAASLSEAREPSPLVSLVGARRERAGRRSWRKPLSVAAGFVLAVSVGASAMFAATADDRRIASGYRALLGVGHGSYFAAAPLREGAVEVGTVWGYAGDPSWVFVSMRGSLDEARWYRVWVVTADGTRVPLGRAELGRGWSSWGRDLPVDLASVREMRLDPEDGGSGLIARFDPRDPWSA
jgi:hypothetical protein